MLDNNDKIISHIEPLEMIEKEAQIKRFDRRKTLANINRLSLNDVENLKENEED